MNTSGFNFGAAIQDVLTRGLDVAKSVAQSRFHVNDPAGQVTGPNGNTATIGTSANGMPFNGMAGVPQWAWIAGAGLGALVLVLLLRK